MGCIWVVSLSHAVRAVGGRTGLNAAIISIISLLPSLPVRHLAPLASKACRSSATQKGYQWDQRVLHAGKCVLYMYKPVIIRRAA